MSSRPYQLPSLRRRRKRSHRKAAAQRLRAYRSRQITRDALDARFRQVQGGAQAE